VIAEHQPSADPRTAQCLPRALRGRAVNSRHGAAHRENANPQDHRGRDCAIGPEDTADRAEDLPHSRGSGQLPPPLRPSASVKVLSGSTTRDEPDDGPQSGSRKRPSGTGGETLPGQGSPKRVSIQPRGRTGASQLDHLAVIHHSFAEPL